MCVLLINVHCFKYFSSLDKCAVKVFQGKYYEMSTFVGPLSDEDNQFDPKIFEDPKIKRIKGGFWVRSNAITLESKPL